MTVTPGALLPVLPYPHRCKLLPRYPQYGHERRTVQNAPTCAALPPRSCCSAAAHSSALKQSPLPVVIRFLRYAVLLTPRSDRHPAAAAGHNFSAPLFQTSPLGHRLQTLLHFVHLPICQMSPLHAKRDIWCLEYYLTVTIHGQDTGRFDAYVFAKRLHRNFRKCS